MAKLAQMPANDRAPHPAGADVHRIPRAQTLYYAFLSYSHRDEQVATWIQHELEQFHVPRSLAGKLTANGVVPKRLAPIFRDRHELAAADDLSEEIENALACSQFLVVLCSPESARSRWTNAEIEYFKRRRPDGCVFAAIVAGEPFASELPGREFEECFPPALLQKYDRRGRPTGRKAEPLAADLRGDSEARRLGLLKLIAGMLGVGLDELVQRETTQRHRRLAWLAAASLAGMAVTSTLAVTAIQSRDAARDQRREAEGLVAFMLGDLKDKLEPIGRLDALDGVGSRVLAYYSKQDTSELSDAALLQRSRALGLTAQVAYLRGDFAKADGLYRQALAGTAEALRRDPDNAQHLFDHAQNVFWVGDIARLQGRLEEAERANREYMRLAERMVAIEPDDLKLRMELQYARENLGIVLLSRRRFAEAARYFRAALGPMQSLAALDPDNSEYQLAVSNTLAWLADTEQALGRLDSATRLRAQQIAFVEGVIARGAADVELRQHLVPARQGLGLLLTMQGKPGEGVKQYRQALEQAGLLLAVEPSNTMWQDYAASVRLELARNLLAQGDMAEASAQAITACRSAASFSQRRAGIARWRKLQTTCLEMRGRVALARNDLPQAVQLAGKTVAAARLERSDDPIADRYRVAAAYRLLGDARKRAGDSAGALSAWSAGLAQLPRGGAEKPREMNERAELLARMGRSADARLLMERLASIGYRRA